MCLILMFLQTPKLGFANVSNDQRTGTGITQTQGWLTHKLAATCRPSASYSMGSTNTPRPPRPMTYPTKHVNEYGFCNDLVYQMHWLSSHELKQMDEERTFHF